MYNTSGTFCGEEKCYLQSKFNQRQQEQGEIVDSFITALHCLSEHCGYGQLHNEMVWD